MVKIIENKKTIKLQRGNRIIERDLKQYQDNKAKWPRNRF